MADPAVVRRNANSVVTGLVVSVVSRIALLLWLQHLIDRWELSAEPWSSWWVRAGWIGALAAVGITVTGQIAMWVTAAMRGLPPVVVFEVRSLVVRSVINGVFGAFASVALVGVCRIASWSWVLVFPVFVALWQVAVTFAVWVARLAGTVQPLRRDDPVAAHLYALQALVVGGWPLAGAERVLMLLRAPRGRIAMAPRARHLVDPPMLLMTETMLGLPRDELGSAMALTIAEGSARTPLRRFAGPLLIGALVTVGVGLAPLIGSHADKWIDAQLAAGHAPTETSGLDWRYRGLPATSDVLLVVGLASFPVMALLRRSLNGFVRSVDEMALERTNDPDAMRRFLRALAENGGVPTSSPSPRVRRTAIALRLDRVDEWAAARGFAPEQRSTIPPPAWTDDPSGWAASAPTVAPTSAAAMSGPGPVRPGLSHRWSAVLVMFTLAGITAPVTLLAATSDHSVPMSSTGRLVLTDTFFNQSWRWDDQESEEGVTSDYVPDGGFAVSMGPGHHRDLVPAPLSRTLMAPVVTTRLHWTSAGDSSMAGLYCTRGRDRPVSFSFLVSRHEWALLEFRDDEWRTIHDWAPIPDSQQRDLSDATTMTVSCLGVASDLVRVTMAVDGVNLVDRMVDGDLPRAGWLPGLVVYGDDTVATSVEFQEVTIRDADR